MNTESRFIKELSPTIRANMGDNQIAVALIYDARGNGGGAVSPTITGDHQNRITDYTAIVVQISQSAVYREDEVSVSITVCGGSYGGAVRS